MAKQLQIWIKAISDDQLIVLFSYVTYFASLYTGARLFLHCNLSCHYTIWIHSLCSLTPFVKKIKALNMTKLVKSQLIFGRESLVTFHALVFASIVLQFYKIFVFPYFRIPVFSYFRKNGRFFRFYGIKITRVQSIVFLYFHKNGRFSCFYRNTGIQECFKSSLIPLMGKSTVLWKNKRFQSYSFSQKLCTLWI